MVRLLVNIAFCSRRGCKREHLQLWLNTHALFNHEQGPQVNCAVTETEWREVPAGPRQLGNFPNIFPPTWRNSGNVANSCRQKGETRDATQVVASPKVGITPNLWAKVRKSKKVSALIELRVFFPRKGNFHIKCAISSAASTLLPLVAVGQTTNVDRIGGASQFIC